MTPEDEIAHLRSILRKVRSITWWARLTGRNRDEWFMDTEQEVINRAFGDRDES